MKFFFLKWLKIKTCGAAAINKPGRTGSFSKKPRLKESHNSFIEGCKDLDFFVDSIKNYLLSPAVPPHKHTCK